MSNTLPVLPTTTYDVYHAYDITEPQEVEYCCFNCYYDDEFYSYEENK